MKTHYKLFTAIFLTVIAVSFTNGYSQVVAPMMEKGDVVYVFCTNEGAKVRKDPYSTSPVLTKLKWLKPYVIIEKFVDPQNNSWINIGKYLSLNKANQIGWVLQQDLLMGTDALKGRGLYKKAIVVIELDRDKQSINEVFARFSPNLKAKMRGSELRLNTIYHIFDKRRDKKFKKNFVLLGRSYRINIPEFASNTLIGWVDESRLFNWNTREAAQYDKSTLGIRDPIKIYRSKDELKSIILGKVAASSIKPLAVENIEKTELLHTDPRFPIISGGEEINGTHIWHIGFAADEIEGPGMYKRDQIVELSEKPSVVDVMIVFDGTGSMKNYKEAVIEAVRSVQAATKNFWEENYPTEVMGNVYFSLAMFKDYSEAPNNFNRLPLAENNVAKIEKYLSAYTFTGGIDQPAVFNGIVEEVKATMKEFHPNSFKALFLIGDMGNMGRSKKADEKGLTRKKVAKLLRDNNIDFYAIHTASNQTDKAFIRYRSDAMFIRDALFKNTSAYITLTEKHRVKEEIYDRVMSMYQQRYITSKKLKQIARGNMRLGAQISGTIIEHRVIKLIEEAGLDPEDFRKKGRSLFAKGWVTPVEMKTGTRTFIPVVLMERTEIETLIHMYTMMARVSYKNVRTGWVQALRNISGDEIKIDARKTIPAEIIEAHLGIQVRSGILKKTLDEIASLSVRQITEITQEFKRKLFLLRALIHEQNIKITTDRVTGKIKFQDLGEKKYFFGELDNQRAWLEMEKYLP